MKRVIILILLTVSFTAHARILNVPAGYATIQSALNAAVAGDTVLLAPGTYHENVRIPLNGIRLGSMFLVTGDTAYISQTILKPKTSGALVGFGYNIGPNTLVSGLTITWAMSEGGISMENVSPTISDCRIIANTSLQGGGINCQGGAPTLHNLVVSGNYAHSRGGGIYLNNAKPIMVNVVVTGNTADLGAGFYCTYSDFSASGLTVSGNITKDYGGGLYLDQCDATLTACDIHDNQAYVGGGLYVNNSAPVISSCVIRGNHAVIGGGMMTGASPQMSLQRNTITANTATNSGGGIYFYNPGVNFSSSQLNSIYLNRAPAGHELFAYDSTNRVTVPLDTFSVQYPTDYYANPGQVFTITSQHYMTEQVESDLYVAPSGNDMNSGLAVTSPLKTVDRALSMLRLDSTRRFTVHLAEGIYSSAANGETFPVGLPSYTTLTGSPGVPVILAPDSNERVLWLHAHTGGRISNLTLRGGGIECIDSHTVIDSLTLKDTLTYAGNLSIGGAIRLDNSSIVARNLDIQGFYADMGGGIDLWYSSASVDNLRITGCKAYYGGAMRLIVSSLKARGAEISGNTAESTAAAFESWTSTVDLANSTITGNITADSSPGVIQAGNTAIILTNSILWEDTIPMISFEQYSSSCTLTASNCDIHGGESSIVTHGAGSVNWGEGMITDDPRFNVVSSIRPYTLLQESPCRDAGTPDTTGLSLPPYDLAGQPRIWNNRVDMGAYEWNNIGINEPGDSFTLEVLPNPVRGVFTVRYTLPAAETVSISVLDVRGRPLIELTAVTENRGTRERLVDGTVLPGGPCLVRLTAGKAVAIAKAIVIH